MEFFPHIDVMMAESTIDLIDQDTQVLLEVNTFLNLSNNWLLDSKYNFTLLLESFTLLLENFSPYRWRIYFSCIIVTRLLIY